jgi:hypothetical protein
MLHHSTHPWKMMKVRNADNLIDEAYGLGYKNLMRKDYHWLKQPIHITKKLPFENKLQWIESVQLARIRFDSATVAEYLSF